jgi:cysteinyl-tRNA synthetase
VEERDVGDGDGCTVFVDVYTDEREKQNLPREIQDAVIRRRDARAKRDYKTADALQKQIQQANYKSVPTPTIHTIALNYSPN